MNVHTLSRGAAALLMVLAAAVVTAQSKPQEKDFQPHVGQAGKDVIWVP